MDHRERIRLLVRRQGEHPAHRLQLQGVQQLLGQRMKIADKIGEFKKNNDITILQTNRWNEILERAYQKGDALGLTREFITKYFDAVHMESINHQNRIMNS